MATAALHQFGIFDLLRAQHVPLQAVSQPDASSPTPLAAIKPNLAPPSIEWVKKPETKEQGRISLAFKVRSDAPVRSLKLAIAPIVKQDGLSLDADFRDVPSFFLGRTLIDWDGKVDLTASLLAGMPVTLQVVVEDQDRRKGESDLVSITLPERSFNSPLAKSLYEARRLIQKDPSKKLESLKVLAGVLQQRENFQGRDLTLLALRSAAVRIALDQSDAGLRSALDLLWHAAVMFEENQPRFAVKS